MQSRNFFVIQTFWTPGGPRSHPASTTAGGGPQHAQGNACATLRARRRSPPGRGSAARYEPARDRSPPYGGSYLRPAMFPNTLYLMPIRNL